MPRHPFTPPRGRVERISIRSDALRGNLLGDPFDREIAVYLPEGYDATDRDYPLLVELASFTGSGLKRLNWRAFEESVPQRIDRLTAEGAIGPVVLALPDAFTSLGGNQYVDSPVLGRWETFVLREMLPRLEDRFRIRRGSRHRAVYGKSSGGYGALVQAMRHGREWRAAASHSGDVGFDLVYRPELPGACSTIAAHGGSIERFLEAVRAAPKLPAGAMETMMVLALAGSFDPDPASPPGLRLPVDLETCTLDPERWAAWLAHDPLAMASRPDGLDGLRALDLLYLDCGARDEYRLQFGTRAFARRLREAGVPHLYEEHDGGHFDTDARLDRSIPLLYRAVAG